jgi:hypothetical protein|tara:strand:+ start:242 stop:469 length:228 start_codon:yes stop_codon:yes gene_type:complete
VLAELLQLAEATMIATTLSIGIVATGSSIINGTPPPDLSTFITSVQPPYESDDKRIYPEKDEEKEILPPEQRIQN